MAHKLPKPKKGEKPKRITANKDEEHRKRMVERQTSDKANGR